MPEPLTAGLSAAQLKRLEAMPALMDECRAAFSVLSANVSKAQDALGEWLSVASAPGGGSSPLMADRLSKAREAVKDAEAQHGIAQDLWTRTLEDAKHLRQALDAARRNPEAAHG